MVLWYGRYLVVGCLMLILCQPIDAQGYRFCEYDTIGGLSWSPDGARLAVMTQRGVLIYDRDLTLLHTVEAPSNATHRLTSIEPTWSPDGNWLVLPQRSLPESFQIGGGHLSWSMIDTWGDNHDSFSSAEPFLRELIWRDDNEEILLLSFEDYPGLDPPFMTIERRTAITDAPYESIEKVYTGVEFENIQWVDDETFSLRSAGVTFFFNAETLEPIERAPIIDAFPWTANGDGSREALYMYDLEFYVRELGQEAQVVELTSSQYSDGGILSISAVHEIQWLPDNERLIALYWQFPAKASEQPDVLRILQGAIVDAVNAIEINHFFILAEGEIDGYALSSQGDRLALHRDFNMVELWNPLANEHLMTIDVPVLPVTELCGE